jgi:cytidylate kinase
MPLDEPQAFDADCMVRMMEDITGRIAQEGNAVVVGRGSPYFLRERGDTFRVFLYAPRSEKVRRLIGNGTPQAEAEELVDNVDRERMTFIKHYFNADWPTRWLYHLMINTMVGDDKVIETILNTMRLLQDQIPAATSDMRGVALK